MHAIPFVWVETDYRTCFQKHDDPTCYTTRITIGWLHWWKRIDWHRHAAEPIL